MLAEEILADLLLVLHLPFMQLAMKRMSLQVAGCCKQELGTAANSRLDRRRSCKRPSSFVADQREREREKEERGGEFQIN